MVLTGRSRSESHILHEKPGITANHQRVIAPQHGLLRFAPGFLRNPALRHGLNNYDYRKNYISFKAKSQGFFNGLRQKSDKPLGKKCVANDCIGIIMSFYIVKRAAY